MRIAEFHEFLVTKYGAVIDRIENKDGTIPNLTIRFAAGVAQATKDACNAEKPTFNFNDVASPSYKQFTIDCFNDATLSLAMRDISQMGLWFLAGQKQIALVVWQLLSGGASATAIRQHAANNNFTLP